MRMYTPHMLLQRRVLPWHRQPPGPALTSTSRGPSALAHQERCVQAIAAIAPLHPAAAAKAIVGIWRWDRTSGGRGTSLLRRLAAVLIDCMLAGGRHSDAVALVCGEHEAGLLGGG